MERDRYFGHVGRILEVDLSRSRWSASPLPFDLIRNYLGGKGFGAKILYDLVPGGCDPLSDANVMVFATGPFTGTLVPTSSRSVVCTKSPLTGLWLDSNCGGFFGPELKKAGYDVLVVKGRAENPTCLVIEDDSVKFIDADELWGMDALEASEWIKGKFGENFRSACIGQAGERLVRFAAIISEGRAFGRGGSGAVMGSKSLKAIILRGTKGIEVFDAEGFMRVNRESYNELAISPDSGGSRPRYGTNSILSLMNEAGLHPVRNFQSAVFEGTNRVNEHVLSAEYYKKQKACFGCPIACSKVSLVDEGGYKGSFTEGPDYEDVWSMGAQCGNTDLGAIVHGENLCDRYGLDAISTGNVIGFAMECYEKGILSEEEIGFPLKFGDDESMIRMIELIGRREGIGELLGEGVASASRKLDAEKLAMHVKGLEMPAYEPRASFGMGLAYATSDRGACHLRSWPIGAEILRSKNRLDPLSAEFKAEFVKNEQDLFAAVDSVGICLFSMFTLTPRHLVRYLLTLTGISSFSSTENLLRIGERIYNLTRLFNLREGMTADADTLPERILREPMPDGPVRGSVVDLDTMLKEYYAVRHWSKDGIPEESKLAQLGLLDLLRGGQVRVRLKFLAGAIDYSGKREMEMDVSEDLKRALEEIGRRLQVPLAEKLDSEVTVLVNGRNYRGILEKGIRLKSSDVLAFVPIVAGGGLPMWIGGG